MTGQGITVKGKSEMQQIITALNRINGQVLAVNNAIAKQGKVAHKAAAGHRKMGDAAKGNANSMKTLALRFVGYNLAMNMAMGAQQKVIEFMGESIEKYREFETRLAEISTILQEDITQMDRFKVGIEELSITYGQSTSDISKGLYDILSAAFDSRDAMNLLNASIKASIAGLSDVRTSVKIFTTVLNSYGKSAEQATHVSDVLFQSVVRGKFQFADLEQALGYVVPIAAQAGISFDELSAALSTATRHGLHIDMTARGLALAIQGIVNPSEKARKAAQKYGVEMDGLSLRVLGLKGWFDQLGVAMDKHGRSILGELVPNMRSLRVAMVLAGEEGAKGFADDLVYLENVTGRTDEALRKMMDTHEFIAKQLAQRKEELQRNIAEPWSEAMLEIEKHLLGFATTFGMWWNVISDDLRNAGTHWDNYTEKIKKLYGVSGKAMAAIYKSMGQKDKATAYIEAFTKATNISSQLADVTGMTTAEIEELSKALEKQTAIINITVDGYNTYTGAIKDTQDALGEYEITLNEIELDMARLNKALNDSVTVGWGNLEKTLDGTLGLELAQLEMQQKLKDSQHDVKMGLISSTYEWRTNNTALQEAVNIVREHEDAQKEDTAATNRMTIAMRHLQIAMLEIQLAGMMRRRGLTRSEQKMMKKLQIEQAKLRLENMKSTKNETVEMYDNYEEKKQFIKEFLAGLEEESYQLKYKYEYDIAELNTFIASEKTALENRKLQWEIINNNIFEESAQLVKDLNNLPSPVEAFMTKGGEDIPAMIKSAEEKREEAKEGAGSRVSNKIIDIELFASALKRGDPSMMTYTSSSGVTKQATEGTYGMGDIVGFQRGTEYIPETMPVMAHKGESIVPAGRQQGDGGVTIEHVTIQVKEIADIGSAEKLSATLARADRARLTRGGKTTYEVV